MLAICICLGDVCVVLIALIIFQDNKNTKLSVENRLMKDRMDSLREKLAEKAPAAEDPLTVESIQEAIRHAGYVPNVLNDDWVKFMIQGDAYNVQTDRLPRVFVDRGFTLDPNEWDMEILRHAAHLMSDELAMVKALIIKNDDETWAIRFMVAAEDRNYSSFRDNLQDYIELIEEGRRRMGDIYEEIIKRKREAAIGAHPFMPAEQQENKVLS